MNQLRQESIDEMFEQEKCEHYLATFLAYQENVKGKPVIPLGNCVQCHSTISLTSYEYTERNLGARLLYAKTQEEKE